MSRSEADLLAVLVGAVPMAMLAVDANARIIHANPLAEALLGGACVGRPAASVLRHPAFLSALDRALAGDRPAPAPVLVSPQGMELNLRVHAAPIALPGGMAALVALEDRSALEHAESMRRDFVANVSHELRTPLTALVGFIETLRGPARDDAGVRDRFLSIMEREAGRMIRLVNDLLSLSRVEAGERQRPSELVDLSHLVRSVVQTLRPQALEAGVALGIEGDAGPILVPADADQLTQVVQNLVENAVKYGGGGERVRICLTRIAREPALRGPAVRLEVIDSGEGIDPIHLPRLTERFYRVDTHRSREKGGTGLGLAIVKHIVNRHRGRMRIESRKGKGSNFIILLPMVEGRPPRDTERAP